MRSRTPLAITAAAVLSLAIPASASAGNEIQVKDLGVTGFFDPDPVEGFAGNPVGWYSSPNPTANAHNVKQDKGLFRSGDLSNSFTYSLPVSAGTFPYHCEAHGAPGGVGMSGKLKIKPVLQATKRRAGATIPFKWGGGETGDQFDVRYKGPGTDGKYKTWLKNTELEDGEFGLQNDPVKVKPDKNYYFQARSENSSNGKGSGFSPPLKVHTGT